MCAGSEYPPTTTSPPAVMTDATLSHHVFTTPPQHVDVLPRIYKYIRSCFVTLQFLGRDHIPAPPSKQ